MFSAIGVEGYNENNAECMNLRKVLNYDCVKSVTTRDDYVTLQNNYIVNKAIQTAIVADPACSISQIYVGKNRNKNAKRTGGLGIGRADLFKDYNKGCSELDIIEFWQKLYYQLTKEGYNCVFYKWSKSRL